MFNSSPIFSWEGAAAFFNWASSGGAVFWFWAMVVLCIVPLVVAYRSEQAAEAQHG